MASRNPVKLGERVVLLTELTIKLLNLTKVDIPSQERTAVIGKFGYSPAEFPNDNFQSNRAILKKNQFLRQWDRLPSAVLREQIEELLRVGTEDSPEGESEADSELWLLKALAAEKALFSDLAEIEESYLKCSRGNFQSAVVFNNLGVFQAQRQRCFPALEFFKKAIFASLSESLPVKAPYYNLLNIIAHLRRNNLFLRQNSGGNFLYKHFLDDVYRKIPSRHFASTKSQSEVADAPSATQNVADSFDHDLETTQQCLRIFEYVESLNESRDEKDRFFLDRAVYLVPEIELWNSFGDSWDHVDREAAEKLLEKGRDLLEKESKFYEAIQHFEMAIEKYGGISSKAQNALNTTFSQWAQKEEEDFQRLLSEENYEEAIKRLTSPPHKNLKRENETEIVKKLLGLKINKLIQEADALKQRNDNKKAILKYKEVLREDLESAQREHVSNSLAELISAELKLYE